MGGLRCGRLLCIEFLSVVGLIHLGWAVVFLFLGVVFEFLEGLFNVPLHADSDGALCVIPFEMHSYVLFGFSINFERVFGTDTGDDMINILFVCVFDTEVVDHESEGDVPYFMEKKPFCVWGFVVTKFLQVCNEIVMSNFPGLF